MVCRVVSNRVASEGNFTNKFGMPPSHVAQHKKRTVSSMFCENVKHPRSKLRVRSVIECQRRDRFFRGDMRNGADVELSPNSNAALDRATDSFRYTRRGPSVSYSGSCRLRRVVLYQRTTLS